MTTSDGARCREDRAVRPTRSDWINRRVFRAVSKLPGSVVRKLAGPPLTIDGNTLDPQVQLGMRLLSLTVGTPFELLPLEQGRAQIASEAYIVGSDAEVGEVREILIPGSGGKIAARLYRPLSDSKEVLPLLVYFHGGGFVLGSLESADSICRVLARKASVAMLSIDYRLAPEHPFPAAVVDSVDAFLWAVEHANNLGVDPNRVGVGGESAGGNLAAVVAQETVRRRRQGEPIAVPLFQQLFMPVTDLTTKHRSYELFREGLFLTEAQMDWYRDHYVENNSDLSDPRVSPLLAEDLTGLPAANVITAGFDPLRDEGEAYAERMKNAGVHVVITRHSTLVHGLVNAVGAGRLVADILTEAAGALRTGLCL